MYLPVCFKASQSKKKKTIIKRHPDRFCTSRYLLIRRTWFKTRSPVRTFQYWNVNAPCWAPIHSGGSFRLHKIRTF